MSGQRIDQTRTEAAASAAAMMKFESAKKSAGVAYFLWFLLGIFGVHRFYLRRTGSGAIMLVLALLSILLVPVGIGAFLFFVPAI